MDLDELTSKALEQWVRQQPAYRELDHAVARAEAAEAAAWGRAAGTNPRDYLDAVTRAAVDCASAKERLTQKEAELERDFLQWFQPSTE